MDRREWLAVLGVGGIGLSTAGADDHGAGPPGGKFMAAAAGFHHHFCGIHVAKSDPRFQLVTQHYCCLGKRTHQCLLFASCDEGAKLIGVEYIVSDEDYRKLPEKEKRYWHPHTYEVLAGGLIAPSLSAEEEMKFMTAILPTWGKTWHTWPDPSSDLPVGEPLLMWSLGADGQMNGEVVAARDRQFGVDTARIREARGREFKLAVPDVPLPKSMDEVGRQWTASGDDKPTRRE